METAPAIEVVGLTKSYGGSIAVSDIDLEVDRGGFMGLLGPNGAGKSTTLKAVTGLLRPTAGQILVNGIDVARDPRSALSGVGCLIETPEFYKRSTPMDVLGYTGRIKGLGKSDIQIRSRALLEELRIYEWRDKRIESFSKGMRQRVALAQALLGNPSLLVLDEPTTGLDPRGAVEFRNMLKDLRRFEVSLLLSTHNLSEVSAVCDSVAILRKGSVVAQGGVRDLIKRFASDKRTVSVKTANPITDAFLEDVSRIRGVQGTVKRSDFEIAVEIRENGGQQTELADTVMRYGLGLMSMSEDGDSDLEKLYMSLSLDGDPR
ncbi:MAG: ABC transporter ATP-binding protein [Euryarchaeota archaeon]|nr:ABC transporter ATP-binding protein [Euryarchaeota archaeon]